MSIRLRITCMVALCAMLSSTAMLLGAGIAAACAGGGGGGCEVPTASTGSASSITSNSATLSGSVNARGCTTYYVFEWGTSSSGPFPDSIEGPAGKETFPKTVSTNLTGLLQPSTQYYFRLSAINSEGKEATGSAVPFKTSPACAKPTVTTGVATVITKESAILNGSVNPNGCQTTYRIEWGPSSSPSSYPFSFTDSAGKGTLPVSVFYPAQNLQANTSYHFRVLAVNNSGPPILGLDKPFKTMVGHEPILFVHGWNGSTATWNTYVNWFQRDGWAPTDLMTWTYNSAQSNAITALEVDEKVDLLLQWTGAKKVDIVTHSMGAFSSRYYLKNLGGTAYVDDFVSLSGPNHGSYWANGIYGITCFSAACEQMRVGSDFLKELNSGDETPGAVNYATWRVTELICDELVTPTDSVVLAGAALNVFSPICVSHSGMHEHEFIYKEVREFIR